MKYTLANRLSRVEESATLKMAAVTRALVEKGVSILNFSVGEPHFPVPASVQEAAIQAVKAGKNRYSPVPGNADLRARLARKLQEENGLKYKVEEIAVSIGAKQAIYNLMMATLNEGDDVLVPAPYWTSYPEMVKLCGGNPVILATDEKSGFKLTPQALKKGLTSKTKMLLLNSPSNPTGSVYSKIELQGLADVLKGTEVWVCSDEIYEKLLFTETSFTSFASLSDDAFSRTITINGFSKAFAMTGWRLGYAAGPLPLIKAMLLIQGQSTSGANTLAQAAAVTALELGSDYFKTINRELRQCRDLMGDLFSKCPLLSFYLPDGAFYLFVNISKVLGKRTLEGRALINSEEMALHLLEKGHVSTVPGSGFGSDVHLRLSFSARAEDIREGCRRVIQVLEDLR